MSDKKTKEQILEDIKDELKQASSIADDTDVQMSTTVMEAGLDSVDFVELIMNIEVRYHIVIPDTEAEKFAIFGAFVDYLYGVLNATEKK